MTQLMGPVKFEITDLHVFTAGPLGYSHPFSTSRARTPKTSRSISRCASRMYIGRSRATG